MWLNELFVETPIDFEKRCKLRIKLGIGLAVLGFLALLAVVVYEQIPVIYLEENGQDFIHGFYTGVGFGLIGAGIATAIKNRRYLKNPDLKKQRAIYETDERNRMLGLRCWAYTGYSFLFILYIGLLAAGFFGRTVLSVLLVVMAVYALLLLIFRRILRNIM